LHSTSSQHLSLSELLNGRGSRQRYDTSLSRSHQSIDDISSEGAALPKDDCLDPSSSVTFKSFSKLNHGESDDLQRESLIKVEPSMNGSEVMDEVRSKYLPNESELLRSQQLQELPPSDRGMEDVSS